MIYDFCDDWLFHDGDIITAPPEMKGPVYMQTKTECRMRGPASFHYCDAPDDYGVTDTRALNRELTHERWERVTLPHDYMIGAQLPKDGNPARGFAAPHAAWYRKHFTLNNIRGKHTELIFDGITKDCEVYLNGVLLARHHSAYTPFSVDISDVVRPDEENVLAVRVDNTEPEGWWYEGGGITRRVTLSVTDRVTPVWNTLGVQTEKSGDSWDTEVAFELANYGGTVSEADVSVTLTGDDGEDAASAHVILSVSAYETKPVTMCMSVKSPHLWDITDPYRYTAALIITANGVTETYRKTYGYRTAEFTNNGFFLNGRRVTLYGVCGHGDFGLTGRAVPDNIHRYKAKLLHEMGVNAYRCSHYMQDDAFMEALEREGILVMAETRHFSSSSEAAEELATLVKRDRSRPSVILWSIGNEEPYFITDEGRRIAARMAGLLRRLDPTRPIIVANDKKPEACTVYDESDVIGINYNLPLLDVVHERYPDKPLLSSECCATGTTRGWYRDDSPERGYLAAYDKDTNAWFRSRAFNYRTFAERPWLAGSFQWTGIEYRGEAAYPRICSQSGAIDLFLQKKDAFYQNKTFFSDEPTVHLLPHWNFRGEEGRPVTVRAYTNAASCELFLDGKSLGRVAASPFTPAEWIVPYCPGKLSVVAFNSDGQSVASDEKETTGMPASLRLRLENADDLTANGRDLALFTCCAVDAAGNEVPDASPMVSFSVSRGARLIGTGSDISDRIPPEAPDRKMRAGKITVAVLPCAPRQKSGEKVDSVSFTLFAESAGLSTGVLTVEIPTK